MRNFPSRYTRGFEMASSKVTSGDHCEIGSSLSLLSYEPDLHGLNFVEHFGGALDEQIGEAGRGAGVDQRGAVFLLEAFGEGKLLGLERVARQVRAQVHIVRAQAQRRAHHDLIEDRGGGVDDKVAAARGADDPAQIARVDFGDGDGAALAEKTARALGVAVAAPDRMSLPLQSCASREPVAPAPRTKIRMAWRKLYHKRRQSSAVCEALTLQLHLGGVH